MLCGWGMKRVHTIGALAHSAIHKVTAPQMTGRAQINHLPGGGKYLDSCNSWPPNRITNSRQVRP